jgi:DNA-binding winged helix-turn-helix (wHTH) protein/quinol monooxygenase YgiN
MSLAATIASVDNLSELAEESQVVVVDHLRVAPQDAERFAEAWAGDVAFMERRPGFVSAELRSTADVEGAYVSIVVWSSAQTLRESLQREASPGLAARFLLRDDTTAGTVRSFGSVEVHPETREVWKDNEPVRLTFKEYELLLALVSSPRRVFSRDELMDRVWGYRAALETGTLSVHMRRLRAKLEDDPAVPRHLQTVWGIGYRFVP